MLIDIERRGPITMAEAGTDGGQLCSRCPKVRGYDGKWVGRDVV